MSSTLAHEASTTGKDPKTSHDLSKPGGSIEELQIPSESLNIEQQRYQAAKKGDCRQIDPNTPRCRPSA